LEHVFNLNLDGVLAMSDTSNKMPVRAFFGTAFMLASLVATGNIMGLADPFVGSQAASIVARAVATGIGFTGIGLFSNNSLRNSLGFGAVGAFLGALAGAYYPVL
jgi:hypothetical protein